MSKDLKGFIAQEEEKRPGSVIRVKDRIDPNKFETIAFLKHLDMKGLHKMVLFENLRKLSAVFCYKMFKQVRIVFVTAQNI